MHVNNLGAQVATPKKPVVVTLGSAIMHLNTRRCIRSELSNSMQALSKPTESRRGRSGEKGKQKNLSTTQVIATPKAKK